MYVVYVWQYTCLTVHVVLIMNESKMLKIDILYNYGCYDVLFTFIVSNELSNCRLFASFDLNLR